LVLLSALLLAESVALSAASLALLVVESAASVALFVAASVALFFELVLGELLFGEAPSSLGAGLLVVAGVDVLLAAAVGLAVVFGVPVTDGVIVPDGVVDAPVAGVALAFVEAFDPVVVALFPVVVVDALYPDVVPEVEVTPTLKLGAVTP